MLKENEHESYKNNNIKGSFSYLRVEKGQSFSCV